MGVLGRASLQLDGKAFNLSILESLSVELYKPVIVARVVAHCVGVSIFGDCYWHCLSFRLFLIVYSLPLTSDAVALFPSLTIEGDFYYFCVTNFADFHFSSSFLYNYTLLLTTDRVNATRRKQQRKIFFIFSGAQAPQPESFLYFQTIFATRRERTWLLRISMRWLVI